VRLAWFSPLPPIRSGIAAYSAEILPLVARHHEIDVFVDAAVPDLSGQLEWAVGQGWSVPRGPRGTGHTLAAATAATSAPLRASSAFDFLPLHRRQPYDLVVYQVGNAAWHDYAWAYLVRFPGLVVLHDGTLHHARARALLGRQRQDDYRAEFRFSHPGADPLLAEHAVMGLPGNHYYRWPMRRLVVETARAVAVHNLHLADAVAQECPGMRVIPLRMGVRTPVAPAAGAGVRRPEWEGIVFAAYGLVTEEKRVPLILGTFASVFAGSARAHLLLVGGTTPAFDPRAEAERLGIAHHVTVTGYVEDDVLDAWIHAADVCLCLRWPTSGESSGPLLRCLAAGKPTAITALSQHLEVPVLDARQGTVYGGPAGAPARTWRDAAALSVDMVDEPQALALAMRRLAADAPLREALARNAAAYASRTHRLDLLAEDYLSAIATASALPPRPVAGLPPHLLDDGGGTARRILADFGVTADVPGPPPAP
jgi:glycosyltransferase involved in cell wall biosynthesis